MNVTSKKDKGVTLSKDLRSIVASIHGSLADLADALQAGDFICSRCAMPNEPDALFVRALIKARRLRDRFLPADLFQDPSWDILLDLTLSHMEGRNVSVSSLSVASAAPATTGLRHITVLERDGLIRRIPDPKDRRRYFMALSDTTRDAMLAYLRARLRLAV